MDLYFKRHDGQAVTCDDFRAAMADANGRDFSAFTAWCADQPARSAVPVASAPVPKPAPQRSPLSRCAHVLSTVCPLATVSPDATGAL